MDDVSYRVNRMVMAEESAAWPLFQRLVKWGVLVPDTRLEAIADAWNDGSPSQCEALKDWPELYDALTEETDNDTL